MRRGLTQRTVLASIVVAVVVLGEFAVLFLAFQNLRAEERQDNQAVNVLATSSDLEESLLNLSTGLRIYLSSGQPAGLRPYQAALAAYPRQARELDRLTAGNPSLHKRVAALGNSIAELRRHLDLSDHPDEPGGPARRPASQLPLTRPSSRWC